MITLHHDGLSRPLGNPTLRALSLGAGVQSTTLALMSARGDLEPLDCAFFADTRGEPREVYRHLDWLESILPFPVYRTQRAGVSLGQLMLDVASGERDERGNSPLIPYFVNGGMIPKQCSKEFKTRPVGRAICDQLGIKPRQRGPKEPIVELWLGMSTDELQRLKRNEKRWIHNRFPLVEARMDRNACIRWMEERQYPVAPKSSCVFCPFRGVAGFRRLRDTAPDEFAELVKFDIAIRSAHPDGAYLLKSKQPLGEANLDAPDAYGFDFNGECEGACGV